jgi:hypothetical protein
LPPLAGLHRCLVAVVGCLFRLCPATGEILRHGEVREDQRNGTVVSALERLAMERVHDARCLCGVVEPEHDEPLVEPGRVDDGSRVRGRLELLDGTERCERIRMPHESLDDSFLRRGACVEPAGLRVCRRVDCDRGRTQGLFEALSEEEERRGELHCRLSPSLVVDRLGQRLTAQLRCAKLVSFGGVHTLEKGERLGAMGARGHGW